MKMPIYPMQTKYSYNLIILMAGASIVLILTSQPTAVGSLWLVFVCLYPAIWVSLKSSYLSLQIFCVITLVTQLLTVPLFYVNANHYHFSSYRPFNFEVLDAFTPLMIVGLFLLTTIFFVMIVERLLGKSSPWADTVCFWIPFKASAKQLPLIIGILLLIIISLPIKFWMFDRGVGIVGVESPQLPFRLSGILFYTFGYLVPVIIACLYIKTRRKSLPLALLIAVYAVVIGVASSSKGVVLLSTAAIIAFAWIDKKYVIFLVSMAIVGFGVGIVETSRQIVHTSDGLTTKAMTEFGVLGTLFETIFLMEWNKTVLVFFEIAGRVESFQGLFLASQFNAEVVGGPWNLLIKSMNSRWVDLGHDVMHYEYLGYTIPYGFYNISASVNAWMLMASNRNLLMILPFVLYVGTVLVLLEKMVWKLGHKYKVPLPFAYFMLFVATFWFFTGPGSLEFIFILSSLVLLVLLPKIRLSSTPPS